MAADRAERYFVDLWTESRAQWAVGAVKPARMRDGSTDPVEYCVTTVARLEAQADPPTATVLAIQDRLRAAGPRQFYYPAPSLHVSLLGCTRRRPRPEAFSPAQVAAIRAVCGRVLAGRPPAMLALRGVGVVGNQIFVQVYPDDRSWEAARRDLDEALRQVGEAPISYADRAPIHLNIARVTDASPDALAGLLEAITALRAVEAGRLEVSVIDFLLTDFVLAERHTRPLGGFRLGPPA